jgi:outer membrane protein assembly factor BamB
MRSAVFLLTALAILAPGFPAAAADWPQWRYDAGRTASSPEELDNDLYLIWEARYPPREPVWDDPLNRDLMHFDTLLEPVAAGGALFIGFNDTDKVVSLDAATGEERWRFYTDGPVRLPVAVSDGRVYAVSDDGCLYCLDAADGRLIWRHEGRPGSRRVLGNKRLISSWPARGGVVVRDGTVYYAASIWPFMGTFFYALDAATGAVRWMNDSNGAQWMIQPHNSPSFAGVAPQGAMVISKDWLLVPGGRSVPACFDRKTGAFLHYEHNANNKSGGAFVSAIGNVYFNHHREEVTHLYDIASSKRLVPMLRGYPVLTEETVFLSGDEISAHNLPEMIEGGRSTVGKYWEIDGDATGDLIKAGDYLYAGGKNSITAIELKKKPEKEPRFGWKKEVEGSVERLIAANGRLIAVTREGHILAFGPEKGDAEKHDRMPPSRKAPADAAQKARELIEETGADEGYAIVFGADDPDLLEALVVESNLNLVVFAADEEKLPALRRRFDDAGCYGERLHLLPGSVRDFAAPDFFASLMIVQPAAAEALRAHAETLLLSQLPSKVSVAEALRAHAETLLPNIYESLRPYGGALLLQGEAADFAAAAEALKLPGASIQAGGAAVLIRREGPLPGSDTWTHMLGDVAQTGKSDDLRVRLPLGLLWFGGNSNLDVLVRHGHGPPEQVVGGRLVIQGMDCMSARDVYTGRVLWKQELPDLNTFGIYYDKTYQDAPTSTMYNQVHIPGANARSTNFVVTPDAIYVALQHSAVVLDPATGAIINEIELPLIESGEKPVWGYIGVYEDTLIAGSGMIEYSAHFPVKEDADVWDNYDTTSSRKLIAMDRLTGAARWEIEARHGFPHNAVVAGNGRIYCLDKLPPGLEQQLARRGRTAPEDNRLLSLDAATGEIVWETGEEVFGSFLCYDVERDILLQSTRPSRDTIRGENGRQMIAYRGADGKVIWNRMRPYRTFPLLHNGRIVTESGLFDLETGETVNRINPLTGAEEEFTWRRDYGCNYPIASEHLLTFRSGAAGFCNLDGSGGTGSIGGFKSSCTANLVAADGVLNAPDYTRTCSCAYQNQTSLAMIHDPEVEYWTWHPFKLTDDPVLRAGINFGAPGDRMAENDVLWLEYPQEGSPSPELEIETQPSKPGWFRHHSSRYAVEPLRWIAASGAEGIEKIRIRLRPDSAKKAKYTVRLVFAEPEDSTAAGDRVFEVRLQDSPVLTDFDIMKETGTARTPVIRDFEHVPVKDWLEIRMKPLDGGKKTLICGVEIVCEDT